MTDRVSARIAIALLASPQEWSFRAIETVLAPSGYQVIRAHSGRETLARAHQMSPEVIIIDAGLRDPDALSVCRSLRDSDRIPRSTPIIFVTSSPARRQQRLQAIRAGASEYLSLPIDAEEFALRLAGLVAARRDVDRARDEGLLDPATGLYNARGLARRALELGSLAYRRGSALACVVLAPELTADTPNGATAVVEQVAKVLSSAQRTSDATARLGMRELAIVAPDTDNVGAVRLAERVARAVEQASAAPQAPPQRPIRLRGGYHAVPNFRAAALDPARLLENATAALRESTADPAGNWLRPFQPVSSPALDAPA